MNKRKHMSGRYTPTNAAKYHGNSGNIIYRSIWEHQVMSYLDRHPHVLKWASEEKKISYTYKGKHRTYYPDFMVKHLDPEDREVKSLVEVKPEGQWSDPLNKAKWAAARRWCTQNGWQFHVIGRKEIYST